MSSTELVPVPDTEEPSAAPAGGATSAPYMSYVGFKNYFPRFAEEGVPARFDSSYFGNASGSLVAQVRGTFQFFGLMDDGKAPTDLLNTIVTAPADEQREYLRMLFEQHYADALALDKNATGGQLADVFRGRGLSGATIQKAVTFFLGMADDLGHELSPHFKKNRSSAAGPSMIARKRKTKVQQAPPSPPTSKVATEDQQKAEYVAMLMDLAKSNGEAETQQLLLDRIEKALGIGGGTTQ